MPVPQALLSSQGSWQGKSKLHLPWLPEDQRVLECDSRLTVEFAPGNGYATVAYTWEYQGEPQAGTMLVAGSEATEEAPADVSGGWSDSWHQSGSVMVLKNAESDDAVVRIAGEYSGGEETWVWRVELEATADDRFLLRMTNIDPQKTEYWAVDAEYRRA